MNLGVDCGNCGWVVPRALKRGWVCPYCMGGVPAPFPTDAGVPA